MNDNPTQRLITLLGLTQQAFADKTGENVFSVYRWHNGKQSPSLERFLKWCEIFDFTDWYALFDGLPKPPE